MAPSPRQAGRPKARLAARPSLAVILGRRFDVSCCDLDPCVFGGSFQWPASAAIGSERRRQFPGRYFEPLARALGHPRSYRAQTAGCLRVKDLLIGVPNYWRYWLSEIGKSRRTRRITTQTKPGGLPKRFARALNMSRRLLAFTGPTIRSSQPERPIFRAPSQPPVNPALSSPTTR